MNENQQDESDDSESQIDDKNLYSYMNSNDYYQNQHKINTVRLSNGNIASFTSIEAQMEI